MFERFFKKSNLTYGKQKPQQYQVDLDSDVKNLFFENTRNVKVNGGDYDDLPPSPIIGARLGATAPTLATFVGGVEQYTFDATNDYVIGATEILHAYKEGTDISAHIHWATNGVDGTDRGVRWSLEYTISNLDTTAPFAYAFPATVTLTADTLIPASTADRSHILTSLGTITGTAIKVGAYICWKLSRIASATAAPTADPFGLAVGFHVQQNTLGSYSIGNKES